MSKTEESSLIKRRSERKKDLDPGFVLLKKKKKSLVFTNIGHFFTFSILSVAEILFQADRKLQLMQTAKLGVIWMWCIWHGGEAK